MSEQSFFDNIDSPPPENPNRKKKHVYYSIQFNYENTGRLYNICTIYLEEKQLETYLDVLVVVYYRLFDSLINVQIIKKVKYDSA